MKQAVVSISPNNTFEIIILDKETGSQVCVEDNIPLEELANMKAQSLNDEFREEYSETE